MAKRHPDSKNAPRHLGQDLRSNTSSAPEDPLLQLDPLKPTDFNKIIKQILASSEQVRTAYDTRRQEILDSYTVANPASSTLVSQIALEERQAGVYARAKLFEL
jgi:hypothetical protein